MLKRVDVEFGSPRDKGPGHEYIKSHSLVDKEMCCAVAMGVKGIHLLESWRFSPASWCSYVK